VILDLNADLDQAVLRAAEQALKVAEIGATAHDPSVLRRESRALEVDLDHMVRKVAVAARTITGSDGAVVEVVDNVRSAGVDELGLLTEERKQGAFEPLPASAAGGSDTDKNTDKKNPQ